jgi:hypothetical protein
VDIKLRFPNARSDAWPDATALRRRTVFLLSRRKFSWTDVLVKFIEAALAPPAGFIVGSQLICSCRDGCGGAPSCGSCAGRFELPVAHGQHGAWRQAEGAWS